MGLIPIGVTSEAWSLQEEIGMNLNKIGLALLFLLLISIGIAHVVNPDRFLGRYVRRRGGILTQWKRLEFRITGFILSVYFLYMLYALLFK